MGALIVGVQQLVMWTCGAFFLAWFALFVGEFLTRLVLGAMDRFIE